LRLGLLLERNDQVLVECVSAMSLYDQVQAARNVLQERIGAAPKVGIILGSGLGSFADTFLGKVVVPYGDLPGFPASSVPGHAGQLVAGTIAGLPAVALQGRSHLYEGYPAWQVAFPARVLCASGIRVLVVTNAAGAIRTDLVSGNLMAITDHLNLSGQNPLAGPNDERLGPRFPDLSNAYDARLRQLLQQTAVKQGILLKQGIYAFLAGPSYETPAEVRMLRALGADAVGMSTVPEVIVAAQMEVAVAGISCITNLGAGIGKKPLTHSEVARTAERARDALVSLLAAFLPAAAALRAAQES
jgi:purine-nucleoside phosphorylase